jgi:hypothetical protein
MIKGMYPRDSSGVPWGVTGLTTDLWIATVPVHWVAISDIVVMQEHLSLLALIEPPATKDPFAHIVEWQGIKYLEDGHHRLARAIVRGDREIQARIFRGPHFPRKASW